MCEWRKIILFVYKEIRQLIQIPNDKTDLNLSAISIKNQNIKRTNWEAMPMWFCSFIKLSLIFYSKFKWVLAC